MPDYYNDNVNLPVFQRGKVEYTVSDLIPILVEMTPQKPCKMQPVGVEHDCSFIIDLDYVKNPKDLRADDGEVRKNWVVLDKDMNILLQRLEHYNYWDRRHT